MKDIRLNSIPEEASLRLGIEGQDFGIAVTDAAAQTTQPGEFSRSGKLCIIWGVLFCFFAFQAVIIIGINGEIFLN